MQTIKRDIGLTSSSGQDVQNCVTTRPRCYENDEFHAATTCNKTVNASQPSSAAGREYYHSMSIRRRTTLSTTHLYNCISSNGSICLSLQGTRASADLIYSHTSPAPTLVFPGQCQLHVGVSQRWQRGVYQRHQMGSTTSVKVTVMKQTCSGGNSVSVDEDVEGCKKCHLRWTGCRSYRDKVFDYISTRDSISMLISIRNLTVHYVLQMRIDFEWRPLPWLELKLEKWTLSNSMGRSAETERGRRG